MTEEARTRTHLPGAGSMWFFILADLWVFTCYFACYMYDRGQRPEGFLSGQQLLSQSLGLLNTIILLTSSLCVALCVSAARARDFDTARRFLQLGFGLGLAFLLVKAAEWRSEIVAGLPASTHEFFLYYFMFTGLHVTHVVLGLVILTLVWRELRSAPQPRAQFVEVGASYWHMVDALWIAIFAVLYLMR